MKYTVINSKLEKFWPYSFTEVQEWLSKNRFRFSIANSKDFSYLDTEFSWIYGTTKVVPVAKKHDFRIENKYGEVLPESYFQKIKKCKPYLRNSGRKRKPYRSIVRHSKVHKLIKDTIIDSEYGYMIPPKSRAKAYYVAGSWDAPFRNKDRNWKSYRKTQYKV